MDRVDVFILVLFYYVVLMFYTPSHMYFPFTAFQLFGKEVIEMFGHVNNASMKGIFCDN